MLSTLKTTWTTMAANATKAATVTGEVLRLKTAAATKATTFFHDYIIPALLIFGFLVIGALVTNKPARGFCTAQAVERCS